MLENIIKCKNLIKSFQKKILLWIINILKKNKYNHEFLDEYQDLNEDIDEGIFEVFPKIEAKIAIICDEILFNSFDGVANFVFVTPKNYRDVLSDNIDIFLIATTWRGFDDMWRSMVYKKEEFLTLFEDMKKRYLIFNPLGKVVFYSKEDPVNYEHFIHVAKACDYVFTSSVEKIDDYIVECGHNQVYSLLFGFNPIHKKPIFVDKYKANKEVLFAGSWMQKYPKRNKELHVIFESVLKQGVDLRIIDRNYSISSLRTIFPLKYFKYCTPSVNHMTLLNIYNDYEVIININSIQESETMFAQRVFELLGMGKIVISNKSIGMEKLFPEVLIIDSIEDYLSIIKMSDEEKMNIRKKSVANMLNKHTTFHRVNEILFNVGLINSKEYKTIGLEEYIEKCERSV